MSNPHEEPKEFLLPKQLSCNINPGQDIYQVHNGIIWHYTVRGYPYKSGNSGYWFLPVTRHHKDGSKTKTHFSLADAGILPNGYNDHKSYNHYIQAYADARKRGYPNYQPKDEAEETYLLLILPLLK